MDSSRLQSLTIDLLRFPLAIMVIFIHMSPNVISPLGTDFSLLSGQGLFNIIGIVGSHVLTHIAVPTFYLISGFLFFHNLQKWSWKGYRRKIQSRVKTLIIPYVLWNLVPFLMLLLSIFCTTAFRSGLNEGWDSMLKVLQNGGWHIFYDYHEWGGTRVNLLGDTLWMTGPYDLPLWFLRDLIVVTFLTPLIYVGLKSIGFPLLLILFFAYVSKVWPLIPGFHITAFLYFTTGSYFALNELNIVAFSHKYKYLLIPLTIILLLVVTLYDGTNSPIRQYTFPFFVCSGVFTAFIVASWCIRKFQLYPNKFLVSYCFFIYALHAVRLPVIDSTLQFTQRILHLFIPGTTIAEEIICYLVTPFLTAYLCIAVLLMFKKCLPRVSLLFSGNK